jgi:hypothetical protein
MKKNSIIIATLIVCMLHVSLTLAKKNGNTLKGTWICSSTCNCMTCLGMTAVGMENRPTPIWIHLIFTRDSIYSTNTFSRPNILKGRFSLKSDTLIIKWKEGSSPAKYQIRLNNDSLSILEIPVKMDSKQLTSEAFSNPFPGIWPRDCGPTGISVLNFIKKTN